MKLFQMLTMFLALLFSPVWCQVNTEAMRGNHEMPGLNQNMDLSFAYISGNKEIIFLNASYRLDYTSKSNWYGFFATKYDRAFEKNTKNNFSNRGFAHLRAVKQVLPRIQVEGFLQKEFNHFITLEDRELIGGGLRINLCKQFFIATGTMHEKEVYENKDDQNFMKSTSYINYSVQLIENVTIENTLYYQFKLEALDNYRILWDGSLRFQGADWLSFHINCNYRYDVSDKLNPDGNSYFEITNGLGFQF